MWNLGCWLLTQVGHSSLWLSGVWKKTCDCQSLSGIQWSCGDLSDGYAFGLVASSFLPGLPGAPPPPWLCVVWLVCYFSFCWKESHIEVPVWVHLHLISSHNCCKPFQQPFSGSFPLFVWVLLYVGPNSRAVIDCGANQSYVGGFFGFLVT